MAPAGIPDSEVEPVQLPPVEGSQLEPVQNFAVWKSLFRVSFSVAPVLSDGPLLVTVIV